MAASAVYTALLLLTVAASAWGFSEKVNITNATLFTFSCSSNNGTSPVVMLYFDDIKYTMGNTSNVSMAASGVPQPELIGCDSQKTASGTTLIASVAVAKPTESGKQMMFSFHFRRTNGRLSPKTASSTNSSFFWELAIITVKDGSESTCFAPKDENDWVIAPRNFSFSCQPQRLWVPLNFERSWRTRQGHNPFNGTCTSVNSSSVVLNVTGLQVQAFTFSNGTVRFDASVDCVGYFTGPTLMGLIIGFFLLSIVFLVSLIFMATHTPSFLEQKSTLKIS
eukprot:scpid93097/ scgid23621/ 